MKEECKYENMSLDLKTLTDHALKIVNRKVIPRINYPLK